MLNFITPGPIDIRALTTFGASIKDESAIGRKGTGFKYAVAIILRHGGEITVHSCDGMTYRFEARHEFIRGKGFDVIYCNDQSINATVETGKDWTAREAYRELASNTFDEGGEVVWNSDVDRTVYSVINVRCKPVEEWFGRHNEIFLNKTKYRLIRKISDLEIYDNPTNEIFFRGVSVGKSNKNYRYTYNILSELCLTEDRTFKYDFEIQAYIRSAVNVFHAEYHRPFLSEWSNNSPKWSELDDSYLHPDDALLDKIDEALARNQNVPRLFRRAFYENRKDKAEAMLGDQNPTQIQQQMINRSLKVLHAAGFDIEANSIYISRTLGDEILGTADLKEMRIYINERTFTLGTLQVCHTLLEEFCHLDSRAGDGTRKFQEYLLNKLVNIAMEMAGEVL